MALCIPSHLRQRTSRVYQDHPHFCRVLTSFVPPVHNQGVSLAPLQGHALWKIFLPTTGSFFVCFITDFLPSCNSTFQWTFSCYIMFVTSSYHGWSQPSNSSSQRLRPAMIHCLTSFYAADCIPGLTMSLNIF